MNLNTGFFPPHGYRRKRTTGAYNLPLNSQQIHHISSLTSARSSIEGTNVNESFLPSISSANLSIDSYKPHRRNDFANNHLFIAKRKLERVFLGEPPRNLQATSELIHLFDTRDKKTKNSNKHKRKSVSNNQTSSTAQENHLSVINLVVKPPYPPAAISPSRRSQSHSFQHRPSRLTLDSISSTSKQNFQSASLQTLTDDADYDDLFENDDLSDAITSSANPFDSSLFSVKSIVLSTAPNHR